MDYVLLIHTAEARAHRADASQEMTKAYVDFTRTLAASGRMGDCAPLEPIKTATTVRMRGGKRIVTDGPFAETREQLGGYYVVSTKDLDEALEIAERIPDAKGGSIEVRPVLDIGPTGAKPEPMAKEGTQEYILLIYEPEAAWNALSEDERNKMFAEYGVFTQSIIKTGNYVTGAPLQPVATAKTVRKPEQKRLVTDGPFAETREQLGGYYRVRAQNLDVALDMAARIPAALTGSIEVRPVTDVSAAFADAPLAP